MTRREARSASSCAGRTFFRKTAACIMSRFMQTLRHYQGELLPYASMCLMVCRSSFELLLILRLYRDYLGIVENKMEATI